ncbi:MAG: co-chaperone GroES, partial [Candidatus Aenigmatarchaeota archaeon]
KVLWFRKKKECVVEIIEPIVYAELNQDLEEYPLVRPCGYRVLIKMPKINDMSKGGIALPQQTRERIAYTTTHGRVVDMGPDCYSDTSRYFSKWCKIGDIVEFIQYSGVVQKYKGDEYRMINDEDILGVVPE